jgi:hypothetical protein
MITATLITFGLVLIVIILLMVDGYNKLTDKINEIESRSNEDIKVKLLQLEYEIEGLKGELSYGK